jgi:hypothetical protein
MFSITYWNFYGLQYSNVNVVSARSWRSYAVEDYKHRSTLVYRNAHSLGGCTGCLTNTLAISKSLVGYCGLWLFKCRQGSKTNKSIVSFERTRHMIGL